MTAKPQNETLNAVKAIACVCVVFMHCEFPGILGVVVQAISRWCVPFFFMVSGYYCFYPTREETLGKIGRKIAHVASITLWAAAFYLVVAYVEGRSFSVSARQWFYWIVMNQPAVIVGQLWFLFALLYVYVFYFSVCWLHLRRVVFTVLPLFFVAYIALAQGAHLVGIGVPNCYYRNFLVEGAAFFLGGGLLRKMSFEREIGITQATITLFTSTALCLVERKLLGRDFGVNICTIPQVFAIFLIALRFDSPDETWISRVGKRYSMFVYILHPFVWHVSQHAYRVLDWDGIAIARYLMPVLVLSVTFILSHYSFVVNRAIRSRHA